MNRLLKLTIIIRALLTSSSYNHKDKVKIFCQRRYNKRKIGHSRHSSEIESDKSVHIYTCD